MTSPPIDLRDRPPYTVEQLPVGEAYADDLDRILVSEGEIESRIERLAAEISATYRDRSGRRVSLVCVLQGGMRFFSALTPRLDLRGPSVATALRATRYRGGEPDAERAEVELPSEVTLAETDVLVVEDMVDEGYTLETVRTRLGAVEPNSIDVAVLFDKVDSRETDVDVAHTGFVIPDDFVVGYGIDYDERYRGLRHLGVLEGAAMDA